MATPLVTAGHLSIRAEARVCVDVFNGMHLIASVHLVGAVRRPPFTLLLVMLHSRRLQLCEAPVELAVLGTVATGVRVILGGIGVVLSETPVVGADDLDELTGGLVIFDDVWDVGKLAPIVHTSDTFIGAHLYLL